MPLNASTGEYGDAVADHYDNFYRHRERRTAFGGLNW